MNANEILKKLKNTNYVPDENTKDELELLVREGKSLSGINLKFANLQDANLVEADLRDCDLTRANLKGAHLYGANLENAILYKANLDDANLKNSILTNCHILGANLADAKLENINLGPEGKLIYELEGEKEKDFSKAKLKFKEAEEVYRSMKLTLQSQSLGEDAGNYFIREMICKRKQHSKFSFFRMLSKFVYISTGYGESIYRILVTIGAIIIVSAFLYGIEGVSYGDNTLGFFSSDFTLLDTIGNLIYFSVITFTTVGFGEITPIGPFGKFLTIFEGLISGVILTILIIAMYRRMMDR